MTIDVIVLRPPGMSLASSPDRLYFNQLLLSLQSVIVTFVGSPDGSTLETLGALIGAPFDTRPAC